MNLELGRLHGGLRGVRITLSWRDGDCSKLSKFGENWNRIGCIVSLLVGTSKSVREAEDMTKGRLGEKVHCKVCDGPRNYNILEELRIDESNEDYSPCITYYYIVECAGCENRAFATKGIYEDNQYFNQFNEPDIRPTYNVYHDPYKDNDSKTTLIQLEEKSFDNVPDSLLELYNQIVQVYKQDFQILSAVGLRTLVEGICKDRNILEGPKLRIDSNWEQVYKKDGSTPVRENKLDCKINGLFEQGIITKTQAEALHKIRLLGNFVTHEVDTPRRRANRQAIVVIQHIFENIYEIEKMDLRAKV